MIHGLCEWYTGGIPKEIKTRFLPNIWPLEEHYNFLSLHLLSLNEQIPNVGKFIRHTSTKVHKDRQKKRARLCRAPLPTGIYFASIIVTYKKC